MAIVGLPTLRSRSRNCADALFHFSRCSGVARPASNLEMSAPETNALSPAPDRTITRIALSAAKSSSTCAAASDISGETALRFSGLLKISEPTAPFFFDRILSLVVVSVVLVMVSVFMVYVLLVCCPVNKLNDAVGAHLFYFRFRIADAAQYLFCVLAGIRGGVIHLPRQSFHVDRRCDETQFAALFALYGRRHPEMLDLRIGKHLIDVVDGAAGHTGLLEQFHPMSCGPGASDLADRSIDLLARHAALRHGVPFLLVLPLGLADRFAEAR